MNAHNHAMFNSMHILGQYTTFLFQSMKNKRKTFFSPSFFPNFFTDSIIWFAIILLAAVFAKLILLIIYWIRKYDLKPEERRRLLREERRTRQNHHARRMTSPLSRQRGATHECDPPPYTAASDINACVDAIPAPPPYSEVVQPLPPPYDDNVPTAT